MKSKLYFYLFFSLGIILIDCLSIFLHICGLINHIAIFILSMVLLALCDKLFSHTKQKGIKKEYQQIIDSNNSSEGNLDQKLLDITETMGFDTQQLLWLTQDRMSTFEKLANTTYDVEKYSEQNAASTQEISASISELTNVIKDMNIKIQGIDNYSDKSNKWLKENNKTLGSIELYI